MLFNIKQIQDLMLENGNLKKRISTLETLVDPMLLQDTENKKRHNSLVGFGVTSSVDTK